ncbi:MAG: tetratricopeptide repeat protein [bacterium]
MPRAAIAAVEAALTIHNLATAIEDSGRARDAAALFRRAASLLRRRLGANHPLVIACLAIGDGLFTFALGTALW